MNVVVLMGVSGSGKSTIGQALSRRLNAEFIEGDEFHTRANREKMHAGVPLTDADRKPWLESLRSRIDALLARKARAVVACSALKTSYREKLRAPGVRFVWLRVSPAIAQQRLAKRRGHFFNTALLQSQFDTLEEPADALVVDGDRSDLDVVNEVVRKLGYADATLRKGSIPATP